MHKIYLYILVIIIQLGCSSGELVEHWKNPDIETFEANKVLVIGMSPDINGRKVFEKKLVAALKKEGVLAVKSIDFFDKAFTSAPKSEEELNAIETRLLGEGYDAILFSKVLGVEDKVTVVQSYKNMDKTFRNFKDDYYQNQEIYYDEDYYDEYKIYHAETSLYCICPEKERELIWKGSIDITEPQNDKTAMTDYIKVLIWALKEQQLLMITQ